MRSLASSLSGVSDRLISSASTATSGAYLLASRSSRGCGGVDQAYTVVGEVRGLDDPRPRICLKAGGHVLAVLLMAVTPCLVRGVSDRSHQFGDAVPKLRSQRCQSFLLPATISQLVGVVFDCVVQQPGADHIGVAHAVVSDDADSDPQ